MSSGAEPIGLAEFYGRLYDAMVSAARADQHIALTVFGKAAADALEIFAAAHGMTVEREDLRIGDDVAGVMVASAMSFIRLVIPPAGSRITVHL